MKAIQIKKYGSNDVVEVNETASAPSLSSGKILVNIKASGVNPVDWKIREGYMQQIMPLQFPSTLGMDFSGVVKQVEEDAIRISSRVTKYTDKPQSSAVAQGHLQNWLWQA